MRTNNMNGFTLLEVLLALAILTVIVSVIYGSFSTAGQTVERAEAMRDDTDLARTLVTKISHDIANAYCEPTTSRLQDKSLFYGKKEEVELSDGKRRLDSIYVTTLTNWRTPNSREMDLWEVGYFFKEKPGGEGYILMRREKRDLSTDEPPLEGGVEYEITDKIEELQFRYYDGSRWKEEWGNSTVCKSTNPLKSVEISLRLAGERRYVTQVEIMSIK